MSDAEKIDNSAAGAAPFDQGRPSPMAFTAEALNAWHREQSEIKGRFVVPKFICADGYEVSIQASSGHYCTPRADRAWPYSHFELGFPTAADEEITTYAEDKDRPTGTVYGWVPVSNVLLVINKHGGPATLGISA